MCVRSSDVVVSDHEQTAEQRFLCGIDLPNALFPSQFCQAQEKLTTTAMKDYKTIDQDEKEIALLESQVQPISQDDDKDGPIKPPTAGEQQETTAKPSYTGKQVRGAGVGGGAVGLILGGPILAVIGGFAAAKVAKSNTKAGQFCRNKGQKVSNAVVRGCDWVKNKMQPDGDQQEGRDDMDSSSSTISNHSQTPPPTSTPLAKASSNRELL